MAIKLTDIKDPTLRERILKSPTSEDYRPLPGPQPKPIVRHEPARANAREESHAPRLRVCVTSFRRRLLDPDNLCVKWFVDAIRYAGIIPDDREADIELVVRQEKVARKADERTEIEVS